MSKGVVKNKTKALKKENAIKKAKRKKIIIAGICALVVLLVAALGIFSAVQKNDLEKDAEIFRQGGQSVQLLPDGKFMANLAHNVKKNGTYTKTTEDSRTLINFNVNGNIETGRLENNSLYLPASWDDGHGHRTVLRKTN